jgi:hypothetical protein
MAEDEVKDIAIFMHRHALLQHDEGAACFQYESHLSRSFQNARKANEHFEIMTCMLDGF